MSTDVRAPLTLPAARPLSPPDDFAERAAALGVTLEAGAVARLGDFLGHLLEMNALMNLTAIADPTAMWERHALDALSLLPLLADVADGGRLVDIGSGGGVPGIPIAIARPGLRVTLVEATQKKAAFLGSVVAALGLSNVSVEAARAEQLAIGDLGGSFDVVTARAVARLKALLPITAPFARPGGRVLLIKGQRAEEELGEAARTMRAQHVRHVETSATPTGRIIVLERSAR